MTRIEQMQRNAINFTDKIAFSKNNTKIYNRQHLPEWELLADVNTNIYILSCTAQEIIKWVDTPLAVLSFACSKNPAGTTKSNQYGQEADLSAVSLLPTVLNTGRIALEFYVPNRESRIYGSDTVAYSPQVPFIYENNCIKYIDVISCSSPKYQATSGCSESRIKTSLERRIDIILSSALANGIRNIILGAWGCGGHHNNPELVANAFKAVLDTAYSDVFENIIFAIPESETDNNYSVFKNVLGGMCVS